MTRVSDERPDKYHQEVEISEEIKNCDSPISAKTSTDSSILTNSLEVWTSLLSEQNKVEVEKTQLLVEKKE